MQGEQFIHEFMNQTDITDSGRAQALVQICLSTLGERLYRTERDQLAAQLDPKIGDMLFDRQPPENSRREVVRFSPEEFTNRISERADVSRSAAIRYSRAVMELLQLAISSGQYEQVQQTMPNSFDRLFDRSA